MGKIMHFNCLSLKRKLPVTIQTDKLVTQRRYTHKNLHFFSNNTSALKKPLQLSMSLKSIFTSAEACAKSSRWLWKEIRVSAGVRKPGNTSASLTAMI